MLDKYQESARRFQNRSLTMDERKAHALYGIGSEVGEVQAAVFEVEFMYPRSKAMDSYSKVQKELGDVTWFLSELCDVLGIDLARSVGCIDPDHVTFIATGSTPIEVATMLVGDASKIYSIFQHQYQGENVDIAATAEAIKRMFESVAVVGYIYGYTLDDILRENVAKLERRYSNGHYEEKKSIERTEH